VILGGFFDAGLVDKVHAVLAPMIIGAADAPAAVAGRGASYMAEALRLRDVTVERLGEDILVTGYPDPAADMNVG
jgi:diaminohydroxyphosphoribosylaminopyrimidine deaminase/5-amino-6-(5-phosphoribosylamino)uracil reductase